MADRRNSAAVAGRMEVDTNHVLSRCMPFEPVVLAGQSFSSVEQIFYTCCLSQHGMFSDADVLWKKFPKVLANPSQIRDIVDKHFAERNIPLSAYWIVNVPGVMLRIVNTLAKIPNSPFARCFSRERGNHLSFVEVTRSGSERLFSCGHKKNFVPLDPSSFAGANIYGEALTIAFRNFTEGIEYDIPPIRDLLERFVFREHAYTKTAVIISDSTFRHVREVAGGDIWYQTGLTSGELALSIREKFGNVFQFRFVIVAAGTNDSVKLHSKVDWKASWKPMKRLLKPLRNHPYVVVVFNTGIGVPAWKNVARYTEWFKEVFTKDFGRCNNFALLDWSIAHDQNFFINPNGSARFANLDHDEKHPNVLSTRRIWHHICRTVEIAKELRTVRLETSSNIYVAPQLRDRESLL